VDRVKVDLTILISSS